MGDKYTNQKEFEGLAKTIPSEKILSINFPVAVERERYPRGGWELWYSGGGHVTNIGIETAINEGFHWVCHCDHDELWFENHLGEIAKAIESTEAWFLYTKGKLSLTNDILPRDVSSSELYIERRPKPNDTIKSACCINYFNIPLRRRDPNYFYNEHEAGDGNFLKRVNQILEDSRRSSILINKVTMQNDQEGYTRTLSARAIQKVTKKKFFWGFRGG